MVQPHRPLRFLAVASFLFVPGYKRSRAISLAMCSTLHRLDWKKFELQLDAQTGHESLLSSIVQPVHDQTSACALLFFLTVALAWRPGLLVPNHRFNQPRLPTPRV